MRPPGRWRRPLVGLLHAVNSLGWRGTLAKAARRRRNNADYREWLREREPGGQPGGDALRAGGAPVRAAAGDGPLFSVLMPTCETAPRWLRRAIESVRAQTDGRWELCIADDASTRSEVRQILEQEAAGDPRVRFVLRPARGHISAASNSALELARAPFVALLDHDDELAPDALARLAVALERHPDADLLYSDEDKIAPDGARVDPHFKPDFSPDLLLSQNFISHLGVYRTELVRQVGGFRAGLEGAQDHDLALRVVDASASGRVVHVDGILYHWRATPQSASGGLWRKQYAHDAGCRAIADHLARTGRRGRVERALYSAYRVRYAPPEPAPSVTVVRPAGGRGRSRAAELDDAIQAAAPGSVVVLLGRDCTAAEGCVDELVSQAARPEVAVAGGKVVDRRRRVLHAGYLLALDSEPPVRDAYAGTHDEDPGYVGRANLVQNLSAVSADCMAFRREVFERAGGFDASAFPDRFFDVDFCLRAARLGRIVFTPWAKVVRRGRPRVAPASPEDVDRLRARWLATLPRDPYWHGELDRHAPDFRLRLAQPRVARLR